MPSAPPARGTRQPDFMPSLFGLGYDTYQTRPSNFIFSFVLHTLVIVLMLVITTWVVQHPKEIKQQFQAIDISPYLPSSIGGPSGGGGGGGDRDKLVASKGALPKSAPEQITPPTVVVKTEPKIPIAPTVVAPPMVANLPQMGDPLAAVSPASNGVGSGSGIGSGSGTGVGSGNGPGVGPGWKYQGDVVLWVVIGPDGKVHDVRVARTLGLGLDEKAVEAVKKWVFEPAKKDGQAVAVQLNIDVTFHLY